MKKYSPISNLLIDQDKNISNAIRLINKNGEGACFVLSKSKFKAVITDGDIRSLILKKTPLDTPLFKVFKNKKSFALDYKVKDLTILKKLSKKIKIIPLIDKKTKKVIDYATLDRVNKIKIYDQQFCGNELKYITESVKSGWISSAGKYVNLFEENFGKFINSKYCLATCNGTAGLQLALKAAGIQPNDEIIVPNISFVATINSVINIGAKPVIVDVCEDSYNISIKSILNSITKKTKAIIIVHLYGQPCDLDKIKKICKKNDLLLIQDCAEAIGSKYKNKNISEFGDISVFSFFGNKTITTGEGGMLVTNKRSYFQLANSLRDHGMSKSRKYWHDQIGYNFRMTNIQAAIGLAQLENAKKIIKKKIFIAKLYKKYLKKIQTNLKTKIIIPLEKKNFTNTFWLYNIRILGINEIQRDKLIENLKTYSIEIRNFFYPFSKMPIYKKFLRKIINLKISEKIYKNGICLPSSPFLKETQIKYIVDSLKTELKKLD
jgi:perosamine synthetase